MAINDIAIDAVKPVEKGVYLLYLHNITSLADVSIEYTKVVDDHFDSPTEADETLKDKTVEVEKAQIPGIQASRFANSFTVEIDLDSVTEAISHFSFYYRPSKALDFGWTLEWLGEGESGWNFRPEKIGEGDAFNFLSFNHTADEDGWEITARLQNQRLISDVPNTAPIAKVMEQVQQISRSNHTGEVEEFEVIFATYDRMSDFLHNSEFAASLLRSVQVLSMSTKERPIDVSYSGTYNEILNLDQEALDFHHKALAAYAKEDLQSLADYVLERIDKAPAGSAFIIVASGIPPVGDFEDLSQKLANRRLQLRFMIYNDLVFESQVPRIKVQALSPEKELLNYLEPFL